MESIVELVLTRVVPRVLKIALLIGVGVSLANIAVEFGAVKRIASVARPITKAANLPEEVGTAILATAASTTAGYGMLAEYRESGKIDDTETLIAVSINTFFGFTQHILTFYAPVLIPILGLKVGLMYVGARAAISLSITSVGIAAGALLLSDVSRENETEVTGSKVDTDAGTDTDTDTDTDVDDDTRTPKEKTREALGSSASTLRSILPRLAVIYTVVVVLTQNYDVRSLTSFGQPIAEVTGLPSESIPVIAVYAIDTTSGSLTLAPMLDTAFTPRQAVATMLIGGIVSFAVTTFRRSIPFQYGIWGAKFGSKVIILNTTLKVIFISLTVALLLY
ncbi:MAG: nucleoside recognition protein [Halobacteria archaeon]|nr:nucleoside recognition protein [Halobacteria archaeon]